MKGRLVLGELCVFFSLSVLFKIFCELPSDGPLKYHKSQLLFASLSHLHLSLFFLPFLRLCWFSFYCNCFKGYRDVGSF